MKRIANALGKLNWGKCACAVFVLCGAMAIPLPAQTFTTLLSFDATDGQNPNGGLVQAANGDLHGTTQSGGTGGGGTAFTITPRGTLTTLHSFCSTSAGGVDCTDGSYPVAGLVQETDGKFYGTTLEGGANSDGTVFSISVGLGPFVETRPTSGVVGRFVEILGSNLTGATSVSFNGTAATFKVVSSTLIATAVPSGAATGTVRVVTPGGTLSSNLRFRVLP
jgi:uncharacterized repeat protein (TIGR03803 family)